MVMRTKVLVLVLCLMASMSVAETITWGSADLSGFAGLADGYSVRLYEDVAQDGFGGGSAKPTYLSHTLLV